MATAALSQARARATPLFPSATGIRTRHGGSFKQKPAVSRASIMCPSAQSRASRSGKPVVRTDLFLWLSVEGSQQVGASAHLGPVLSECSLPPVPHRTPTHAPWYQQTWETECGFGSTATKKKKRKVKSTVWSHLLASWLLQKSPICVILKV